jgi:hypothetical protein
VLDEFRPAWVVDDQVGGTLMARPDPADDTGCVVLDTRFPRSAAIPMVTAPNVGSHGDIPGGGPSA